MIRLKNILSEKAVSKNQQKFFGMVYALKNGDLNPSDVSKDVRDAAKSMSMKDVEDFASTKHKGLPKKVQTEGKLNKKDVSYQLSIDYSGRTKPKVTKLNKNGISVFYGYKVNPKDVIKSIKKLYPSIKIKHDRWSSIGTGGGVHSFLFEAKLDKEKFTEPEDMKMYEQRPIPMDTPNEFWYMDYKKWAYKNRGKYKKEILSLGDNTSKIFNTISSWWLAWANKKNKSATHVTDKQKFGRALAIMMKKDGLVFKKSGNKITAIENTENDMIKFKDMIQELSEKKKGPGLWANIHAKRKRGEKPAKPGDEDYPDEKAWKDNTEEVVRESEMECFIEYLKDMNKATCEGPLEEAEYQGRKVKLNKPMQGDGDSKFKVYVKDGEKKNADGTMKVKKVSFGAKGSENRIKKNNPERRKSFRARHNCDNPGPKTKARYWSCKKW
tara:strand:- start:211 stop:1527 length:1317 start_codon:yes stop_codon:yes gene_type:complete